MRTDIALQSASVEELCDALDGPLGHHGTVPIALALTDLDGFGVLNDKLGREAGDRVLRLWEKTLLANVPKGSQVFRLGGDEYAVVLPGCSSENALIHLEEIRAHFAASTAAGVDAALNATIGIAARPTHAKTSADLHRVAGEALMRAKREGAGRCGIYVEEKMVLKTSYYSRAVLDRLSKLATATSRTDASLLREALDDVLEKYRDET